MIPTIIILDTGPLSNCVVRSSTMGGSSLTPSEACRLWLDKCELAGATILVPAITYYETLREIERRNAESQRRRLVRYCFQPGRFLPLTTAHLEAAAQLWAQSRKNGAPTSKDGALDGDVILCAQVQSLQLSPVDYIVAITNTKHLEQFVHVADWRTITE